MAFYQKFINEYYVQLERYSFQVITACLIKSRLKEVNVLFIVHAFTYMQCNLMFHILQLMENTVPKTLGFKNMRLTQVDILTWIKQCT